MAITDLFSKRQRRARGELPDVFQYSVLPEPFRVQLVYILRDLFTDTSGRHGIAEAAFESIHNTLCREYGVLSLAPEDDPRKKYGNTWMGCVASFAATTSTERVLDLIEAAFTVLAGYRRNLWGRQAIPALSAEEAIHELNTRFKEHGIGYQYESGEIIRVDSQFLHAEAVKPALSVLSAKRFAGANAEFLKAHEHYRHGRHGEAMNECLKALESTLKVICKGRNWSYKETDQAKTLLDVVFTRGLIPSWLQSEFNGLRSTLESGVPTVRNKVSGHGAGATPRQVPDYFAAYLLHLTAASIVFLVRADEA